MPKAKDKQLSDVKAQLLELLKEGQWVPSKILLDKTGQKYFDRRLRELRDEQGFDLESGFLDGKPAWRLRSNNRNPIKPRSYLGKSGKDQILQGWGGQCALCEKKIFGSNKPVFDHRIPLIRGGTGTDDNFQLLCVDCNNQKRSQCRGCEVECQKCFLAYPEKYPKGVVLRPNDREFWNRVEAAAKESDLATDAWIMKMLVQHFKDTK
ncbi:MAG TPA: HNH endonuclease signature motif containing protein [Pseudobdellovibrionaceae bacterium]|nr:HNH endonuclease signature motif containing protein [Pseudobdellovibrionaceae bacterium]